MSEEIPIAIPETNARFSLDEFREPRPTQQEKFMVVNNYARFASLDCYSGIVSALREQGFDVLPYTVSDMQAWFSMDMICNQILAFGVSTRNNFTDVMFCGSTFIPLWVIRSMRRCGVKVIYWSLEDPHALDQNERYYGVADYYFTNERKLSSIDKFKKAFYLPTAGNHKICMPLRESYDDLPDYLKNDIVFCGNIYPARQAVLEEIVPFIEKKKYTFAIVGITALMDDPDNSPLKKYLMEGFEGVVDHRWLMTLYNGAKVSINMERDSLYEYDDKYASNRNHRLIGESLNPRAYEIPLCGGALELIDNKRKEIETGQTIQDGKHCVVFSDVKDLCEKIEYYVEHEKERKKIVEEARTYVLDNHTYLSRAERMITYLRLKEGDKKQVTQALLRKLSGKKIFTREGKLKGI